MVLRSLRSRCLACFPAPSAALETGVPAIPEEGSDLNASRDYVFEKQIAQNKDGVDEITRELLASVLAHSHRTDSLWEEANQLSGFAFPTGIHLTQEPAIPTSEVAYHTFVMTGADSGATQRYGLCATQWRRIQDDDRLQLLRMQIGANHMTGLLDYKSDEEITELYNLLNKPLFEPVTLMVLLHGPFFELGRALLTSFLDQSRMAHMTTFPSEPFQLRPLHALHAFRFLDAALANMVVPVREPRPRWDITWDEHFCKQLDKGGSMELRFDVHLHPRAEGVTRGLVQQHPQGDEPDAPGGERVVPDVAAFRAWPQVRDQLSWGADASLFERTQPDSSAAGGPSGSGTDPSGADLTLLIPTPMRRESTHSSVTSIPRSASGFTEGGATPVSSPDGQMPGASPALHRSVSDSGSGAQDTPAARRVATTGHPLPHVDIDWTPLLSRLSPRVIIALFQAILHEKPIVLLSRDVSILTDVAEAMLALIAPIKWQSPLIPVLPPSFRSIVDLLGSPTPFLMGCHPGLILRCVDEDQYHPSPPRPLLSVANMHPDTRRQWNRWLDMAKDTLGPDWERSPTQEERWRPPPHDGRLTRWLHALPRLFETGVPTSCRIVPFDVILSEEAARRQGRIHQRFAQEVERQKRRTIDGEATSEQHDGDADIAQGNVPPASSSSSSSSAARAPPAAGAGAANEPQPRLARREEERPESLPRRSPLHSDGRDVYDRYETDEDSPMHMENARLDGDDMPVGEAMIRAVQERLQQASTAHSDLLPVVVDLDGNAISANYVEPEARLPARFSMMLYKALCFHGGLYPLCGGSFEEAVRRPDFPPDMVEEEIDRMMQDTEDEARMIVERRWKVLEHVREAGMAGARRRREFDAAGGRKEPGVASVGARSHDDGDVDGGNDDDDDDDDDDLFGTDDLLDEEGEFELTDAERDAIRYGYLLGSDAPCLYDAHWWESDACDEGVADDDPSPARLQRARPFYSLPYGLNTPSTMPIGGGSLAGIAEARRGSLEESDSDSIGDISDEAPSDDELSRARSGGPHRWRRQEESREAQSCNINPFTCLVPSTLSGGAPKASVNRKAFGGPPAHGAGGRLAMDSRGSQDILSGATMAILNNDSAEDYLNTKMPCVTVDLINPHLGTLRRSRTHQTRIGMQGHQTRQRTLSGTIGTQATLLRTAVLDNVADVGDPSPEAGRPRSQLSSRLRVQPARLGDGGEIFVVESPWQHWREERLRQRRCAERTIRSRRRDAIPWGALASGHTAFDLSTHLRTGQSLVHSPSKWQCPRMWDPEARADRRFLLRAALLQSGSTPQSLAPVVALDMTDLSGRLAKHTEQLPHRLIVPIASDRQHTNDTAEDARQQQGEAPGARMAREAESPSESLFETAGLHWYPDIPRLRLAFASTMVSLLKSFRLYIQDERDEPVTPVAQPGGGGERDAFQDAFDVKMFLEEQAEEGKDVSRFLRGLTDTVMFRTFVEGRARADAPPSPSGGGSDAASEASGAMAADWFDAWSYESMRRLTRSMAALRQTPRQQRLQMAMEGTLVRGWKDVILWLEGSTIAWFRNPDVFYSIMEARERGEVPPRGENPLEEWKTSSLLGRMALTPGRDRVTIEQTVSGGPAGGERYAFQIRRKAVGSGRGDEKPNLLSFVTEDRATRREWLRLILSRLRPAGYLQQLEKIYLRGEGAYNSKLQGQEAAARDYRQTMTMRMYRGRFPSV